MNKEKKDPEVKKEDLSLATKMALELLDAPVDWEELDEIENSSFDVDNKNQ